MNQKVPNGVYEYKPKQITTQGGIMAYQTRTSPKNSQKQFQYLSNNATQPLSNEKQMLLTLAISSSINKSSRRNLKQTLTAKGSRSGSKIRSKQHVPIRPHIPKKFKQQFYQNQKELIAAKEVLLENH